MGERLLRNTSEIDQTLETLDVLLNDEETFHHVCASLFRAIDKNRDGSLERAEIKNFISEISADMGVKLDKSDKILDGVYAELDADGSNDVDLEELEVFLKRIFIL